MTSSMQNDIIEDPCSIRVPPLSCSSNGKCLWDDPIRSAPGDVGASRVGIPTAPVISVRVPSVSLPKRISLASHLALTAANSLRRKTSLAMLFAWLLNLYF
jgi:hypothetical protein